MDNELKRLKKTAAQIRRDIIEATSHGKGGGILDPRGQATRAETAAMLQRFAAL